MGATKGIFQQMREVTTINIGCGLSKAEVLAWFENSARARQIQLKEENKVKAANLSHLRKKSKLLGKNIPPELLVLFSMQVKPMIGSFFLDKYKDWLT